jgi:hypothetical protein
MGDNMSDNKAVDKVADDHKKRKEESLQKVKDALKIAYESGRKSLWNYVELGKSLINARNIMGKDDFNTAMVFINPRQIQRYIGLVIASKSTKDFKDGTNKDLEINGNIQTLTEGSFDKLKDPGMSKLQKMKSMTEDDFAAVLGGNDDPYYTVTPPPPFTPPTGVVMTEAQYNEYKKDGTKKLIGRLFTADNKIETIEKNLSEATSGNDQAKLDSEEQEESIANLQRENDNLKEENSALLGQNKVLKIRVETAELEAKEVAMAD